MKKLLSLLFLLLPGPGALPAQASPPTAAAVTAPGRKFDRALDILLGKPAKDAPPGRDLVFLVDPTPSLARSGFVREFSLVLSRNKAHLSRTRIGLALVAEKAQVLLPPGLDHEKLPSLMEKALARPASRIQNVYASIRRIASLVSWGPGKRELILVSLDNGDAEDDLEGTVRSLKKDKITFIAVAAEAFLADTYWKNRSYGIPRGVRMKGGDSPFTDLPWGWIFQHQPANEVTPAGFAQYGLNRLAAATGGRIFLYSPPQTSGHTCSPYGGCPFCDGDHLPRGEAYVDVSVHFFAPWTLSRRESLKAAAKEPCLKALLRAWRSASREGLLRSRPSLQPAGSSFKESRNQAGSWRILTGSLQFSQLAARADKAGKACGRIIETLKKDLARSKGFKGSLPRFRAMAELTLILLQVTRVNLLAFSAWCREAAPVLSRRKPAGLDPPEIPWVPPGRKPSGIGWTDFPLCHGVRPFLELHLPGGEAFKKELTALEGPVQAFLEKYSGTPYATALRRSGIAVFHFTYPGKYKRIDRRRLSSHSAQKDTTTLTRRPARAAGGTGRSAGGPTTGGGK